MARTQSDHYMCRWKATAIGANHQSAENILKQDYKDDITLADAVKLVIKVGADSVLPAIACASCAALALASQHATAVQFRVAGMVMGQQFGTCLTLHCRRQPTLLLSQYGTMCDGAAQVLSKTMDSTTLTTDKVELATISRDEADGGRVRPRL
jgi:Proteasome subunit